jgi:hypothetical protein
MEAPSLAAGRAGSPSFQVFIHPVDAFVRGGTPTPWRMRSVTRKHILEPSLSAGSLGGIEEGDAGRG